MCATSTAATGELVLMCFGQGTPRITSRLFCNVLKTLSSTCKFYPRPRLNSSILHVLIKEAPRRHTSISSTLVARFGLSWKSSTLQSSDGLLIDLCWQAWLPSTVPPFEEFWNQ
jgi:hypothetical protein